MSNCRLRLYCVKAARHTFKEEGKMGTTRVMVVTFKMRHFIPVESEEAKKAPREPSSSAPGRAPGSRLGPRSPLPRSLGPPSAIIIVSREPRAREPEAGLPGSRLPGSRALRPGSALPGHRLPGSRALGPARPPGLPGSKAGRLVKFVRALRTV